MNLPTWVVSARKILGRIADFFILGRKLGAWERENGPNIPPKK